MPLVRMDWLRTPCDSIQHVMEGVRPRINLKRQIGETYASLIHLCRSLRWLPTLFSAFVMFVGLAVPKDKRLQGIRRVWPILLVAIAGCGMYSLVHVEARYVAVFLGDVLLRIADSVSGTAP